MTTPIERLRKRHQLWDMPEKPNVCTCTECAEPWPCDTVAALDTLQAENARLREQAEALAEALERIAYGVEETYLSCPGVPNCSATHDANCAVGIADAALRAYREANHG